VERFPHQKWVSALAWTDQDAMDAAMKATDITHFAQLNVVNCPGGQRQRVLVAKWR